MKISKEAINKRLQKHKKLIRVIAGRNIWKIIMLLSGSKGKCFHSILGETNFDKACLYRWLNQLLEIEVIEIYENYPYPKEYRYLPNNQFAMFIEKFQYLEGFKELSMYKRCVLLKNILSCLTSTKKVQVMELLPMSMDAMIDLNNESLGSVPNHIANLKKFGLIEYKEGVFYKTILFKEVKKRLK